MDFLKRRFVKFAHTYKERFIAGAIYEKASGSRHKIFLEEIIHSGKGLLCIDYTNVFCPKVTITHTNKPQKTLAEY